MKNCFSIFPGGNAFFCRSYFPFFSRHAFTSQTRAEQEFRAPLGQPFRLWQSLPAVSIVHGIALALLCAAAVCGAAEELTSLKIGEAIYGAKADARGPIGGGQGYKGIVTKGEYVVKDLDSLLEALAKARTGQIVLIPGETEIDLTARIYVEQLVLEVPAGVTLAGERGNNGAKGALLTSDTLKTPVMIRVGGPGVRITGLRLQGPCPKRYLDHHRRAFGPGGGGSAYYYKFPISDGITTQHSRLEVDNCEISAFAHAGIALNQGDGHRVHHNYIHHCQYNGLGYGISHDQASSLIECNQFDWNRHSIAGTGRPGCSYVARNNVELGESLSHCFDMHGGRDRQDGTDIAGTSIEVYNNTFRLPLPNAAPRTGAPPPAVVIRGVPQDKCDVHHNWFLGHTQPSQAVRAGAKTQVHDNACGAEPKVFP